MIIYCENIQLFLYNNTTKNTFTTHLQHIYNTVVMCIYKDEIMCYKSLFMCYTVVRYIL